MPSAITTQSLKVSSVNQRHQATSNDNTNDGECIDYLIIYMLYVNDVFIGSMVNRFC